MCSIDWLTMTTKTRSLHAFAQLFLDMCDRYSLFQFNSHPSRSELGNILDVILSKSLSLMSEVIMEAPVARCDQLSLRALLDTPEPIYKRFNLWRSDWDRIDLFLDDPTWFA